MSRKKPAPDLIRGGNHFPARTCAQLKNLEQREDAPVRHCRAQAPRASLKPTTRHREATMRESFRTGRACDRQVAAPRTLAAFGCAVLATGNTATNAADVTYERLLKPEPQNWLMNHRDYGSQRFSPLDVINKSNVKNLKLAFAVALRSEGTRLNSSHL